MGARTTVRKSVPSRVLEHPAAMPPAAKRHFLVKLSVETDAWDVYHDMQKGIDQFILADARREDAYAQEHIQGAISLYYRTIDRSTLKSLPKNKLVIVYCTGTGCNAAAKGAARLAALGYRVKEMIGGLEWWKRDGFPTATGS